MKYFVVAIVVLLNSWMIIFQDVTSAEIEACSNYTEQDTCCNAIANCTWYTCKETNITDAKCRNKTDIDALNTTCQAEQGNYHSLCGVTPDVNTCQNYTEKNDCCHSGNEDCTWYTCHPNNVTDAKCENKTNVDALNKTCQTVEGKYQPLCDLLSTTAPQVPTTSQSETTSTVTNATTTTESKQTTTPTLTTTPAGAHFDGASFAGGIVLATGLFLIAIFAYKFYSSRKGKSYHTL